MKKVVTPATAVPAIADAGDDEAVELGVGEEVALVGPLEPQRRAAADETSLSETRQGTVSTGRPHGERASGTGDRTNLQREVHIVEITAGHVWTIVAAAMVFFMTPGLALFYGGMTRAKGVLNMMMMSFISIASVSVVWVLWGASMSSGEGFFQIVGNPFATFGLEGLLPDAVSTMEQQVRRTYRAIARDGRKAKTMQVRLLDGDVEINTRNMKLLAFAMGASFGGIAGSIFSRS